MTPREKTIEVFEFDEEQLKHYEEFVKIMRAYEFEKQLIYYEKLKEERLQNDD